MVMGAASTMACLAEALGMALPGSAAIPATHADRIRCAEQSVAAIGRPELLPATLLTKAAFRNAQAVLQAIGGSANAVIHLAAIAGRRGIALDGAELDALGRSVPVLVDLKPTGDPYMKHFHWAGGVPKRLRELGDLVDLSAKTVAGGTLADAARTAEDVPGQTVIRSRDNPIYATGGLAAPRGNPAPGGAVIKIGAATQSLLQHTGRAVVFDGLADPARRIDDPDLDVEAGDVLVLRNAGPKGAPGMPEAGYLPIPKKLARAGVKDMVRISDARMSGAAFGAIVLHVVPEAAEGGPLALAQSGDLIRLDVAGRRIDLLVDDAELAARRSRWRAPPRPEGGDRGYLSLYLDTVTQADRGCDFGFLIPSPTP